MQIGQYDLYKYSLQLIDSNMYILVSHNCALVIDPLDNKDAFAMLKEIGCTDFTVFLTHEHFDHICGVNRLREFANAENGSCIVYAHTLCAKAITDPLKNLSKNASALFITKSAKERELALTIFDPNYSCHADVSFDESLTLNWENLTLVLNSTPGHTPGSICIEVYNDANSLLALATGDSLIPNQKTITRLPGGSKTAFREITVPYLKNIPQSTLILPGHGEISYMSANIL